MNSFGNIAKMETQMPLSNSSNEELSDEPFRWKGQAGYVSDYQTRLVYCWNRSYDPGIGRWISRDPYGRTGKHMVEMHQVRRDIIQDLHRDAIKGRKREGGR